MSNMKTTPITSYNISTGDFVVSVSDDAISVEDQVFFKKGTVAEVVHVEEKYFIVVDSKGRDVYIMFWDANTSFNKVIDSSSPTYELYARGYKVASDQGDAIEFLIFSSLMEQDAIDRAEKLKPLISTDPKKITRGLATIIDVYYKKESSGFSFS